MSESKEELEERFRKATQQAINHLNQIWNEVCGETRHRNSYLHWRIPRNWKGTRYQFGYTPWKTKYNGKQGFFAVKYRETKNKIKLVKAVRFGKRKVAKQRSLQWFNAYYGTN